MILRKLLDKYYTFYKQERWYKTFKSSIIFFNIFMIGTYIIIDFNLLFTSYSYYVINFIYLLSIVTLHKNIKYYKKIYEKITPKIEDGSINIIKCKSNFESVIFKYEKNKLYQIAKLNNYGDYMISKDIETPLTNQRTNFKTTDIVDLQKYINKFDFDTLKDKRFKKLKKLNNVK